MFVLTGIMQFLIPDVPVEIKTQIQREQLLAKEAKYQNGLKKAQDNEYNELLQSLHREQNADASAAAAAAAANAAGAVAATVAANTPMVQAAVGRFGGSFMRRMSRMSDGLDAHVEIASKQRRRHTESTVWEVA